MTFEEFLSFHHEWSRSIEHNMGALVEAQQENQREIKELRETTTQLAETVMGQSRVVEGLAQVVGKALAILQECIRKVDELAVHQRRSDERLELYRREAEERERRLDARIDRLVEAVERYINAQARRNGE